MGLNPAGDPVFQSGSDPAGVSLFRMRAPQSALRTDGGMLWHAASTLFFAVSTYITTYVATAAIYTSL